MRETCSSGSVRGGGGNAPTYSATLLGATLLATRLLLDYIRQHHR